MSLETPAIIQPVTGSAIQELVDVESYQKNTVFQGPSVSVHIERPRSLLHHFCEFDAAI